MATFDKGKAGDLLNKLGWKNPTKEDVKDFSDLMGIAEALVRYGAKFDSALDFIIENNKPRYDRFKDVIKVMNNG